MLSIIPCASVTEHPYLLASRSAYVPCSALLGGGHVELKAAPDQLHLVAVVEARQGRFESALTDVAPRADNVGPDFNFQAHDGTINISDQSLPGARTPAHAISVWFPVTSDN
jgi:hypothetical protein